MSEAPTGSLLHGYLDGGDAVYITPEGDTFVGAPPPHLPSGMTYRVGDPIDDFVLWEVEFTASRSEA